MGSRRATAAALVLLLSPAAVSGVASAGRTELTSYPAFENACVGFATGSAAAPLAHYQGDCDGKRKPLVVSATQENEQNNHAGAKNNDLDVSSHMADFDYSTDFDHWFHVKFLQNQPRPILSMMLDTVNFNKVNVTGWPLRYGHLFLGFNDTSVAAALDADLIVEFDIRIPQSEERGDLAPYSGRRIMLGALSTWAETGSRTNHSHFTEIDIAQSPGYTRSYGEPERPDCRDLAYDRCFYDPAGKYAEGREVGYQSYLSAAPIPLDSTRWTHVKIPLSLVIRRLRWVSPPARWNAAAVRGLYLGIESIGATRTSVEIQNYHVYADALSR